MNKNPLSELFGIFNKLAPQQKILISGISVVSIILLGFLFAFLNEPNYMVLYSNLAESDASKVIEQLNADKVQYKIEDGGSTITVADDKVYESRLKLASKGIPSSGMIGYEIFDKSSMGMSEFMQKLNFKRALEGELARTISQQEGIQAARVHIVFPEKSIFKEEQKPPTASVVLKVTDPLSKENVNSIVNLVSSSVEGLEKNKVTLIDTQGNLLSQQYDEQDFGISTSRQYEIKQSIERYLVRKSQAMLDNVLGYSNSMIQVDVELNFDLVEKTMQLYDPESQVAISEQTIKNESTGSNMVDSSAQITKNSTTNYEISSTIEKVVQGTGNIKRMSVAAVINDVKREVAEGKETTIVYEPRSREQLDKLEVLIKNAVGLVEERGDKFSLVNIPFETNSVDEFEAPEQLPETGFLNLNQYEKYINIGLLLGAIIVSLFLLKGLMNKLKNEKIMIGTVNSNQPSFALAGDMQHTLESSLSNSHMLNQPVAKKRLFHIGDLEDEISDEALLKQSQQEKIANYVQKNPVEAAKLINSWLHEDEY
ncbi:MAG: flagellar M-ring protein FliF [Melioribacteraceae bacterium]|nr:flagellar M-ring protein FliF [Melioribacteraceae bacterium]